MECWNEQPQNRPTFKWIRHAVKRLQDDEQVSSIQFNLVFIYNLFGLRRITISDEAINTTVNRCYVFIPYILTFTSLSHSS